MMGTVNVLQVRKYRPKYLRHNKKYVISLFVSGLKIGQVANKLMGTNPAEIKVGKRFYYYISVEVKNTVPKANKAWLKTRKEIRQATVRNTYEEKGQEIGRKISKIRKLWWKNNPEMKEEYAKTIQDKGMGYGKFNKIPPCGCRVMSMNEFIAHKVLYIWGIPHKSQVYWKRKFIDIVIDDDFIEIDGMNRDDKFWHDRFGKHKYFVIRVKHWNTIFCNRVEVIINGLYEFCTGKGHKIARKKINIRHINGFPSP